MSTGTNSHPQNIAPLGWCVSILGYLVKNIVKFDFVFCIHLSGALWVDPWLMDLYYKAINHQGWLNVQFVPFSNSADLQFAYIVYTQRWCTCNQDILALRTSPLADRCCSCLCSHVGDLASGPGLLQLHHVIITALCVTYSGAASRICDLCFSVVHQNNAQLSTVLVQHCSLWAQKQTWLSCR